MGGEGCLGGLEDFQDSLFPIRHLECGPCTGVRTETADEVIDLLGRLLPVDLTGFLKNFGGRMKYYCLCIDGKCFLIDALHQTVTLEYQIDGLHGNLSSEMHQSVIDKFDIGLIRDGEMFLKDDPSGVDIMVEEEGGDTRFCLTIDHRPVDGCSTPVLGQ